MIKNYLKILWRSFLKNKKHFFINIFGLAAGIACSLLIFLFVTDELSYDRFHADADNIHRVAVDLINDDGTRLPTALAPAPLAPVLQNEIPEVVQATRFYWGFGETTLVSHGDKNINESKILQVDSSFFKVFTFPFISGNPTTALKDVNTIVLTESAAKRYFGDEDPMGKLLRLNNTDNEMVTGIVKDVPANTHFHFDFLISLQTGGQGLQNWNNYNYYTYVKVKEGTDPKALDAKIQQVYERNQANRFSDFYTQPLTGIHLTSQLHGEFEPNGDIAYVYIFSVIGFFILMIAAINYINLSTAKSSLRAKEVGIRKVSGAERSSLVQQFLLESILLCLIASLVAIVMAVLLLPIVNEITRKELSLVDHPSALSYMVITVLLLGVVAGIFPALYLSSFKPVTVLKGLKLNEAGTLSLRKTLVIIQFTISIVLIIGAIIITQQISFLKSAKLGMEKKQVVVVKNVDRLAESERTYLLTRINELPGVKNAAIGSGSMGELYSNTRWGVPGSSQEHMISYLSIGYDYLNVIGVKIIEGRGFSPNFPADVMNNGIPGGPLEQTIGSIVINEKAVQDFGLEEPAVGKLLTYGQDGDTTYYLKVVGVVQDFHFASLRHEIKPFGFVMMPSWQTNYTIKLSTDNLQRTLAQLEQEWIKTGTASPFEYVFMDETFARLYAAEERFQKVVINLVVLGIIISCLGLYGLATFAAEQRVKEIGIRKVLGASVTQLVLLMTGNFLKLVVISLTFAAPIAWYLMRAWLQDFTYRISIEWWVFVLAGVVALVIAFLTISSQALKAALTNPATSIRTE